MKKLIAALFIISLFSFYDISYAAKEKQTKSEKGSKSSREETTDQFFKNIVDTIEKTTEESVDKIAKDIKKTEKEMKKKK